FTSIRALTAIAASRGYHLVQADIDKAYLHGDLEEELYIRPPKGAGGLEGKVLKLHKSIYGLKQAGRTWNEKIDASLRRLGFTRSQSDHCVYVRSFCDDHEYIALYVDDLLFVGPDRNSINEVLDGLEQEYGVKRLGDAEYILGIQICRGDNGTIGLSQQRYIQDVLDRFGLTDCMPSSVPMSPSSTLLTSAPTKAKTTKPTDQRRYRQLVGALTYAMTGTRPDIALAVSTLGRFANDPADEHWQAGLDVLRYLKGTMDEGLVYGPVAAPLTLSGRSDATWISCPETSRSVNGYHINLGGAAIAWSSRRQRRCACSSTDAEYLGLGDCTRTIVGLRDFLSEIHCPQPGPTLVHGDNQGANALAKNPEHHQRSRHVRLSEHIVREHVSEGLVNIQYLPTNEMSADALTKPLGASKFIPFKREMGVVKIKAC
ncbi:MAG: reverse transcriptase domain-containing protein, partial [Pseudomonas amygdali]